MKELSSSIAGFVRCRAMTRKEAVRRLQNLALEAGHKRHHYVKRALLEFLEKREALLPVGNPVRDRDVHSEFDRASYQSSKFPH
jgi:hypothetical protein